MHFLNHKLLGLISRLMLAAVLFTQYSLATQACMIEAHPAMAFAVQAMPDCAMHKTLHSHPGQPNPNACFVHCTASDLTLDTHHAAFNPMAVLPSVALIAATFPEPFRARIYSSPLLTAGGPPLYLLLQNFRN